ncbi:hypothetical protein [Mycobacterium sp. GA-2829]|uniref:hypothetical protein n=1 Tax=Mycobacterium sp. GA-2829 TaxID=1772283 RepID=UPI0007400F56|nr:hypothetical protein AU194_18175 [Mycobacterium sp. GA-2829]
MYPTYAHQPVFTVSTTKHTGLLLMWMDQSATVTGTFEQCDAALRQAQTHNLLAGWWSPLSMLLLNWFALLANWSARKTLHRQAARARAMAAHPSAQPTHPYRYPAGYPQYAPMPAQPAGYRA